MKDRYRLAGRLGSILLAVLVLAVFAPLVDNSYTNWDEEPAILLNPLIVNPSWESVGKAFSTFQMHQYTPVTILSFMAEYAAFGFEPFITHLIDIVLHMATVLLVFAFLMRLRFGIRAAIFIAALFAVHPMQVESVAWIHERRNLLYGLFFFGSLLAHADFARTGRWGSAFLAMILLLVSLCSKSLAVTAPVMFFLVDFRLGRGLTMRTVMEKIPFFVLVGGFTVLSFAGVSGIHGPVPVWERIIIPSTSILFYVYKLLLPVGLSCIYPYPERVAGAFPLWVQLGPVFLTAVLASLLWAGRRERKILWGAAFFLVNIFPVSRFFAVGMNFIAGDHFVYVPILGFLTAAVAVWSRVFRRGGAGVRKWWIPAMVLVVLACGGLTRERVKVWKNTVTLFQDVIGKYPHTKIPYNQIGLHYLQLGNWDEALSYYSRLIEQFPEDGKTWLLKANALVRKGDLKEAMTFFGHASRVAGEHPDILFSRGTAHLLLQDYWSAFSDFGKVLAVKPEHGGAQLNRAWCRLFLGDPAGAFRGCVAVMQSQPENPSAWTMGVWVAVLAGRPVEAMELVLQAMRRFPGGWPVYLHRELLNFLAFGSMGSKTWAWGALRLAGRSLWRFPFSGLEENPVPVAIGMFTPLDGDDR